MTYAPHIANKTWPLVTWRRSDLGPLATMIANGLGPQRRQVVATVLGPCVNRSPDDFPFREYSSLNVGKVYLFLIARSLKYIAMVYVQYTRRENNWPRDVGAFSMNVRSLDHYGNRWPHLQNFS